MNENQEKLLKSIYDDYHKIIRPNQILIEAYLGEFPVITLNEIRALFDHIAQCYTNDISSKCIDSQLRKAKSHVKRIILDSFKIICLYFYDEFNKFEKKTKNIDLTIIDNGNYYLKFKKDKKEIHNLLKEAKKLETDSSIDIEKTYLAYENVANKCYDLDKFINEDLPEKECFAKRYKKKLTRRDIMFSIGGAVLGAVLSLILSVMYDLL